MGKGWKMEEKGWKGRGWNRESKGLEGQGGQQEDATKNLAFEMFFKGAKNTPTPSLRQN